MKRIFYLILFFLTFLAPVLRAQELNLYEINLFENNKNEPVAFFSLSDKYTLSEHPDSLAIPSLEGWEEKDAQHIQLDSVYRKRFLITMNLSETDNVFIYDYARSILKSFPLKELNLAANITPYEPEWPYRQEDYYIGFEISKTLLSEFDTDFFYCFVYVGKKNPFVVGKVKPLTWEKIDRSNFPQLPIDSESSILLAENNYSESNVYVYKDDNLRYFIQEYVGNEHISARRLVVINLKTKEVLCERIFIEDEGSSLTELNSMVADLEKNQWTGKLFKHKPPVVFGFKYFSFGCEWITFLKSSENDLYIQCDNRH